MHPGEPSEPTVSKAVLVTGASSGIGRKITEHLAAQGHLVYATARKEEDLKALGAIKNVQPLRLDVTQPADIAAAVEAVTKAGRGLYGLVNNAGVATFGTIASMRMEEFDLSMKVNVYGPVMMIKAFTPLIVAEKGRIVNIGSPSGITDGGGPDIAAYVMSKHAIEGLTDSLVLQLGPLGVQVTAVEPGAYRSDMDKNMLERLTEDEKANMLKVWGPPPDPMMFPGGRRGRSSGCPGAVRAQSETPLSGHSSQRQGSDESAPAGAAHPLSDEAARPVERRPCVHFRPRDSDQDAG